MDSGPLISSTLKKKPNYKPRERLNGTYYKVLGFQKTILSLVATTFAILTANLASPSLILKVNHDLIVNNSIYVHHIATIRLNVMTMCVHRCDQISEGRSNLRKYTTDQQTCECYHATSDFRDSRNVAPKMNGCVMIVNPPLLINKLYLVPCEFQIASEHAAQISTTQKTEITKNECLDQSAKMGFPVHSATFCPDEEFCGLSLRPENTTQLKLHFKKTCLVFGKNVASCRAFETQLVKFDFDECQTESCGNETGTCQNIINQGYDCVCYSGFERRYDWDEGKSFCDDVDECRQSNKCPGSFMRCQNEVETFRCVCQTGFEQETPTSVCTDIDECDMGTEVCPGPNDYCENTVGSFICPCETSGFDRISETSNCSDVNECASNSDVCPGPFDSCNNTHGSFECPCEDGFERLSEETDCVDINECLQDVCFSSMNETCSNNEGGFTCVCMDGFERVSTAESDCVDINECIVATHDCISAAHCINSKGSFACARKIYVTGGTSSEEWSTSYALEYGYTIENGTETPTSCFYSRNTNSEYAHLDIPLSDVTQVKLLNYPSGYAHHMEHTFVEVCEKNVSCQKCGDPAPATGGQKWAVFDCQGSLRGNQIKIMRIGDILTFCEIDISGLTVVF